MPRTGSRAVAVAIVHGVLGSVIGEIEPSQPEGVATDREKLVASFRKRDASYETGIEDSETD